MVIVMAIAGEGEMFGIKISSFLLICILVTMQDIQRCSGTDELPVQHGVNFIGIGYNIIEGNPEGGELSTGGVDPGLLVSRRILGFTFEDGKTTSDLKNRIPDEVTFVRRDSEFTTSSLSTFYGTKSYASKLSAQVDISGGYEGVTASVEFAASARYEKIQDRTSSQGSVFLSNQTINNLGHARYQTELARTGQSLMTTGFVVDACHLPATFTDATKDDYMEFLDGWGTHIVTEVALGVREGENFEESRSAFVNYAAQTIGGSLKAGGGFGGFSASISVDMESFTSSMDSETSFGKTYSKYRIGSTDLNEPISIKLMAMPELFETKFWAGLDDYIAAGQCTDSFDLATVKSNLDSALRGYAEWHQVSGSSNPDVRIALTWPDGVYGLPEPHDGCPDGWNHGHRIHKTGEIGKENDMSDHLIFASWAVDWYSRQAFCMKTVAEVPGMNWQWQPGSYCIYQYGDQCPKGFTSGHLKWGEGNMFDDLGVNVDPVPAGTYDKNTEIKYCCRNDGLVSQPIHLPTDDNFMLFTRFDQCQLVNNMQVRKEWIYWDTILPSTESDVHPGDGVYEGGIGLMYCYYHVGEVVYSFDEEDLQNRIDEDMDNFWRAMCNNHPELQCD